MDVIQTGAGVVSALIFFGRCIKRFWRWIRNAKMVELGTNRYGNKIYQNKNDGKFYEQNYKGDLEEI